MLVKRHLPRPVKPGPVSRRVGPLVVNVYLILWSHERNSNSIQQLLMDRVHRVHKIYYKTCDCFAHEVTLTRCKSPGRGKVFVRCSSYTCPEKKYQLVWPRPVPLSISVCLCLSLTSHVTDSPGTDGWTDIRTIRCGLGTVINYEILVQCTDPATSQQPRTMV